MNIIYSYNKRGFEADYWKREIEGASDSRYRFIPFNHDPYLDPSLYLRAQLLDNLYFANHSGLMQMYSDLQRRIAETGATALIVDNCFPYHPEFLRTLPIYKVMRTTDGPITAYDRDFAYLHAYDHLLYHSPAYSRDLGMAEKLRYCGAKRSDFLPLGSFDALCDPLKTEETILAHSRDIDVIFIGALHPNKMPLIAEIKKALGKRLRLHGLAGFKKNAYFNLRFGAPGWIRPISFEDYVALYQRARIGINIHNRGDYTVGSYRLFDLPANGVMQISDGGAYLGDFFEVGKEIESYVDAAELIEKVRYFLAHDEERQRIAQAGFRRVRLDYRIGNLLRRAAKLIEEGMSTTAAKGNMAVTL